MSDPSLLEPREVLRLPADHPPVLLVVIDTEEEFEWGAGFYREKTSVRAMRGIPRVQAVFDEFGIRPVYVVDYPIATQREAFEPLRAFQQEGRAVVGTHLHPWVNPPFDEEPTPRNSYPGNLPPALLEKKLRVLTDAITETFGRRPDAYKAGRYGLGPGTEEILARLGYRFDLSVCPRVDLQPDDGGPDYLAFAPEPYRFGPGGRMLEIPVTAAFVGPLARWGAPLQRAARHPWGRAARLPALLARSGALRRIRLSPEGVSFEDHRRVTRAMLARGVRILTFSFHSPSAAPGFTPYVASEADLEQFLLSCRRYFDWFLGELGGVALTPSEIHARLEGATGVGLSRA